MVSRERGRKRLMRCFPLLREVTFAPLVAGDSIAGPQLVIRPHGMRAGALFMPGIEIEDELWYSVPDREYHSTRKRWSVCTNNYRFYTFRGFVTGDDDCYRFLLRSSKSDCKTFIIPCVGFFLLLLFNGVTLYSANVDVLDRGLSLICEYQRHREQHRGDLDIVSFLFENWNWNFNRG